MNNTEWTEIVAWVEARYPKAWAAEQNVAYFDDLNGFDISDVWSALFTLYDRGSDFAPTGSKLKAAAMDERRASALRDRYDTVALPEPVTRPIGSWLEKWYPDETVTWTEHIRRVHADGYPCQSRLCDIHNEALLSASRTKENA